MYWIKFNKDDKNTWPNEMEEVIGYCRTKLDPEWHVEALLFHHSGSPYDKGDHLWAYLTAYNEGYGYAEEVTHWMPLPEPPEDINNEN